MKKAVVKLVAACIVAISMLVVPVIGSISYNLEIQPLDGIIECIDE